MAENPVTPAQQDQSASVPVPSDNQIEYTVDALGKPTFPTPSPSLPGHTYAADVVQAQAAVAARFQAATARAVAKSNAQLQRDTQSQQPQHAPTFVPVPRQKKGK